MQIEHLLLTLRPRTKWEAADLGVRMATRWFLPLQVAWLVTAVPFFVIALFIDEFRWQLFFLWWF